jgi:hypothetical protein
VEVFRPGFPCFVCSSDKNPDIMEKILPSKIMQLENLEFLPHDEHPIA